MRDAMPTPTKQAAKEFLRSQFRIMERYGQRPKISPQRYAELVKSTQRSLASLAVRENPRRDR